MQFGATGAALGFASGVAGGANFGVDGADLASLAFDGSGLDLISGLAFALDCTDPGVSGARCGVDAGLVTGPDFGLVTGPDFGLVTGPDFGLVTGPDFGLEAGPDFGLVTGPDFGLALAALSRLDEVFASSSAPASDGRFSLRLHTHYRQIWLPASLCLCVCTCIYVCVCVCVCVHMCACVYDIIYIYINISQVAEVG